MTGRNVVVKVERVEKAVLIAAVVSHHPENLPDLTNKSDLSPHGTVQEFSNRIDPLQPLTAGGFAAPNKCTRWNVRPVFDAVFEHGDRPMLPLHRTSNRGHWLMNRASDAACKRNTRSFFR